MPHYIKPNRYELLSLNSISDSSDISLTSLLNLASPLLEKGVQLCAISLGADGALFVSKHGVWRSEALKVHVKSTVGAGDGMTGALVYGLDKGLSIEECCALSVAASAASCTTRGTNAPNIDLVDTLLKEVRLQRIV